MYEKRLNAALGAGREASIVLRPAFLTGYSENRISPLNAIFVVVSSTPFRTMAIEGKRPRRAPFQRTSTGTFGLSIRTTALMPLRMAIEAPLSRLHFFAMEHLSSA